MSFLKNNIPCVLVWFCLVYNNFRCFHICIHAEREERGRGERWREREKNGERKRERDEREREREKRGERELRRERERRERNWEEKEERERERKMEKRREKEREREEEIERGREGERKGEEREKERREIFNFLRKSFTSSSNIYIYFISALFKNVKFLLWGQMCLVESLQELVNLPKSPRGLIEGEKQFINRVKMLYF